MSPDALRTFLSRRGVTTTTLAAVLHVHPVTVRNWHSGRRSMPPYLGVLLRLVDLGVTTLHEIEELGRAALAPPGTGE